MGTDYVEVKIDVARPGGIAQDLLIAALGEAGYESFLETETGFSAYIPQGDFSQETLGRVIYETVGEITTGNGSEDTRVRGTAETESTGDAGIRDAVAGYEVRLVESQNWNQVWESNFQPVTIGDQCRIRASFHPADPTFPLEIQIDPKMSFGTGHHETTWLMASWLLELAADGKLAGKKVLDMGCGTGVLAILAAKSGAAEVLAADIDPVCIENTLENAALNQVTLACRKSDIDSIGSQEFDLILANINRNVLLGHLPHYSEMLRPEGILLLSGFYEGGDVTAIRREAANNGLTFLDTRTRNRWAAGRFEKPEGG